MTARTYARWAVLILLLLGVTSLVLRKMRKLEPIAHPGESVWQLTYKASFHARKPGAHLLAALPDSTRYSSLIEQPAVSGELELVRHHASRATSRKDVTLRAAKVGQFECRIDFKLHLSRRGVRSEPAGESRLTVLDHGKYLGNEKGVAVDHPAVQEIVGRLSDGQPGTEELVERFLLYCLREIQPGGESGAQDAVEALKQNHAAPLGRARAFMALCRAAKIPARLVTGFEIKTSGSLQPRTWVEVFHGRWEPYDPENGFARELDYNFVPVRRDGLELIRTVDGTDLTAEYSVEKLPSPSGSPEPEERSLVQILDLRRLPVNLHEPIEIILVLPLGALFTAFVRTIVGVRTFGTFTPTLLALAFVYNDWRSGLCVLVAVVIMGFTSRTLLDRLKLLLVPRLSIILTMVVMLMVLGVAVMNYIRPGLPPGETVLLPMVILTNLVERFFVTSEEDNLREAVRLLATTVAMALAIYALLNWKLIGQTLFYYPELHFFTVVALVLIGRYTGYRWTELLRFRDLVRQPPKE